MPSPSEMKGRAVLVTGAASGLGRAAALRLGRAGADVCVVDIEAGELEATAAQLRGLGAKVEVQLGDLTGREACRSAVGAAVAAFGRLDALCNVAGVYLPRHAHEMSEAEFQTTLAVNLAAPFYLMQAALPHLIEAKGAIVNVASCAGIRPQAYMAAYCASKAGLIQMTKALAMEYVHAGVRINAVAPGGMLTTLVKTARWPEDMDRALFGRGSGIRGVVEVEDVAELVAFLASDAARGYHGACISIDNGVTAD